MIRAAAAMLSYLLVACAHDMPREGDIATHRVMGKSDVPPISVALPAKNAALPPSVDDLSSIKSWRIQRVSATDSNREWVGEMG